MGKTVVGRRGERYVREWLSQQAAGGYVSYDSTTGRFALPDEHAAVLADELSPLFLVGAFQLAFGYAHSESAKIWGE